MLSSYKLNPQTKSRLYYFFSLVISLISISYISRKIFTDFTINAIDYRVITRAGNMWSNHMNPYDVELFRSFNDIGEYGSAHVWVYPPNWSVLAIPLNSLDFAISAQLWNIATFAILCFASILLSQYFSRNRESHERVMLATAVFSLLCFSQLEIVNIRFGQTGTIMAAGCIFMLLGTIKRHNTLLIIGAVILCLKPTFAFFIVPICYVYHLRFKPMFIAGVVVLCMSIPAILSVGITETITGFLSSLSSYGDYSANLPPNLSGLTHLVYTSTGVSLNTILLLIIATLITAGTVHLNKDFFIENENAFILFIISSALLVVPTHSYDYILAIPLLAIFFYYQMTIRILIVIILLLMARAANIENIINIASPETEILKESKLIAILALALFLLSATEIIRKKKSN